MKTKNYSSDIHIRTRDDERIHINRRAEQCNISESEYVRRLIQQDMGKRIHNLSKEEFLIQKKYIYEINKIGVNINQIVKDYNSYFLNNEEKSKLFLLMEKVTRLLSEVLRKG